MIRLFALERECILSALADDSTRIEHVGSTSISTVHIKPILDIAILVGSKGSDTLAEVLTIDRIVHILPSGESIEFDDAGVPSI